VWNGLLPAAFVMAAMERRPHDQSVPKALLEACPAQGQRITLGWGALLLSEKRPNTFGERLCPNFVTIEVAFGYDIHHGGSVLHQSARRLWLPQLFNEGVRNRCYLLGI